MQKDIQKSIEIYKEQLNKGDIQIAYFTLMKYIAELKALFPYLTSPIFDFISKNIVTFLYIQCNEYF